MSPTPHHDGHGHAHIEKADEQVKLQETAFIEAYRAAGDKRVFLELTGVHFSLEQEDHAGWHLTHIRIEETFEVGQASPAFGMARLVHQPLPGSMIKGVAKAVFCYQSPEGHHELGFAAARNAY